MKKLLAKSLLPALTIIALFFSAMEVSPVKAAEPNLVGYWALNDGSGATAADSSGYGHPGALTGGSWSAAHAPTGFANSGSLSLDGSSGQGINATQVTAVTNNLSMSAWVNWAGSNSLGQMLLYNGNSGPNGYGIYLQGNGELGILNGGVALASSPTSFKLTVGTWQYIVATRKDYFWKLYVDGTEVPLNGNPAPNPPSGQTSIGRSTVTSTTTFNGLIDDARIYDRVLAATEVCSPAITVTNANDSGAGSLRQAISGLCTGGTITFNGNYTILLASELAVSKNITIDGTGHNVTISGNHITRVFNLTAGAIFMNKITIADGNSGATDGGGIYVGGANLTVTNSTFSGNSGNWPGGGGLELWVGTANVINCTFVGNSAVSGGYGGGIDTYRDTTLNVTNSTFSGNSAASAGGGLSVGGVGNIINSTISGNSAGWSDGGGGINNEGGTVTVTNSIISNNPTGNNCNDHYGVSLGIFTSGTNNLSDDSSCSKFSTISSSILLGALGNYGGSTQTIPLLPGSSAIDKGTTSICNGSPVSGLDQRGITRPALACDLGAFESQGFTLTKTGGDNQSTTINTAFTNPLTLTVASAFSEPVDGGMVTFTGPASGASTNPLTSTATISGGAISKAVTANGTAGGPYSVSASSAGASSIDYSLTQQMPPLTVTINQAVGQADPTAGSPIHFTVVFNRAVTDFTASDVSLSYSPGGLSTTVSEIAPIDGTTYDVSLTGMSASGAITATINAGVATDGFSFSNTASTSTDNSVTFAPQADLSITKTDGVTAAVPGGSVTYTITASNAGPNNASGVTVADTFPASLTSTWTCVGAGGGTCTASGSGNINDTVNLPAGSSVTYTVSASVSASATGTLSNTATVTSGVTDPTPGNNSATDTDTLTPQVDLSITKTDGVTSVMAGGSVTYTITASNAGPSNASGATVADTFLTSLTSTWTCVGAGGGTCTGSGSGNINDTVNLPSGGSVTFTVTSAVSASASGSLSNTATVTPPGGITDPTPGNNSSTDTDTIIPQVGVTINQATGQADPTNKGPINFTVVFAAAVTDFDDAADVTLTGTAGASTVVITGGPSTYNVAVSGMTGAGTVIASIPAGIATGSMGEPNPVSTSDDHTVTFVTNSPPIISEGAIVMVSMSINGSATPFALTLHATDVDSDPLTWSILTLATHGNAGASAGTGDISYAPTTDYTGTDSFDVQVDDGNGGTDSITVNVTIQPQTAVSKINSAADTGDGQVDEAEYTSAAITQLLVVFNNSMNTSDVQDTANYSLVHGTATPVSIDSIGYDTPSHTATLQVNGGTALSEGKYTLTVKSAIHDSLGAALSADFVRVFHVDASGITIITNGVTLPDNTVLTNGATLYKSISEIWVTFNEDAANPAGNSTSDDVTNPANYLLVRPGVNAAFETSTCLAGPAGDDVVIPTDSATYENGGGAGPFIARVVVNHGVALEAGMYRLFVCGTTSITDLTGNPLNNGADNQLSFTILTANTAAKNPSTGFEQGVVTTLPLQPAEKEYANLGDLWLEIPSLDVKASISGVPLGSQGWDLTWLHNQIGWLEGTAYPTWVGNTVLTAHAYTSDGRPGPFVLINNLKFGDTFSIHFNSQEYVYTVRSNNRVTANDTKLLTKHETDDWVTLITCQQYDEKSESYLYRVIVRAVLTSVIED